MLALFVADDSVGDAAPAVAGTYQLEGSVLRFTPRFPLRPGLSYRVVFRPKSLEDKSAGVEDKVVERLIRVPETSDRREAPRVVRIFPSAATLPENQLRFYIYFSTPMNRGEAFRRLELRDAEGHAVEAPFLELGEELWEASGRRFTLLLDPGRVKRGLKPREELGPVLEAGRKYTLVAKSGWTDASGRPLERPFSKEFKVGPAVEQAVDPRTWTVSSPVAGTRQAFTVRFPRPLDQALLERTLSIVRGDRRISGTASPGDEERSWQFTPDEPWQAGRHDLLVDAVLEDTAGNSVRRAFEVDGKAIPASDTLKEFRLPFMISE